ncbi:MAG: diaminopimelate epimerase [Deltaproteobacteria bacterium]|nr:diaminopimelate epimerase [Deltaproteobacteria bacterium]
MKALSIPFTKMSGSGNDFILIDNRDAVVQENGLSGWIAAVCRRKLAVGADGLILIERSDRADFKWRFFNADGGQAEMCGNGGRCAARLAFLKGIAGSSLAFETMAGVIRAEVTGRRVKLEMPQPSAIDSDRTVQIDGRAVTLSHLTVGVPHVVVWVDDIDTAPLKTAGPALRYHNAFAPEGTNVNFVQRVRDGMLAIRTYERGVEDETLACGTGCVATALVGFEKGLCASPVALQTRSGETLKIYFERTEQGFSNVFLEGEVRLIYEGRLYDEAAR